MMDQDVSLRPDLEVDLAIIGAGAAGLLLASALASRGQRLRLIVLEPRQIAPNPRRWIFPARPGHALERFVSTRLDRARMLARDRQLTDTRLDIVNAGDVQAAALAQLQSHGKNPVEEQVRIDGLIATSHGASVQTGRGAVQARYIVDTRPGAFGNVIQGSWTQISWFAALQAADIPEGFALSRAEVEGGCVMLDQSLALRNGDSLIECIGLCPPGDDGAGVKARLAGSLRRLGIEPEAVPFRRAVLPLHFGTQSGRAGAIIHAPAGVGGLRFGPGLAALQLARWAELAAIGYTQTGRLLPPPSAPRGQRRAAAQLIRRLDSGPEKTARWLNETVEALPADAALRFLGGVPGWGDGFTSFRHRWLKR